MASDIMWCKRTDPAAFQRPEPCPPDGKFCGGLDAKFHCRRQYKPGICTRTIFATFQVIT